jgi:hypothetical protein
MGRAVHGNGRQGAHSPTTGYYFFHKKVSGGSGE